MKTLIERFEQTAAALPDKLAVLDGTEELSYGDLNRRADGLAAGLLERGIRAGDLVAIALPRSAAQFVAMFAVVKAGAAFLPLDLDHPALRLAHVVGDAAPRCVITSAAAGAADWLADVPIVDVDEICEANAQQPQRVGEVSFDHPAYVLYTSGSTGEPKGVITSHRALANRLAWMQERYPLAEADRVVLKTPCGFDVSIWEYLWALNARAAVVVCKPGGHRDPRYLAQLMADNRVTVAHFVPSMLRVFVDRGGFTGLTALRRVFCSGEALPADLVRRLRAETDVPVHNLYGPTEAAIDVTAFDCPGEPPGSVVPIGTAVPGCRTYVLDDRLDPVTGESEGELYLAGVQLAHGYLGRPDLTAERFVADPFGGPGERMYRTGDLVRRDGDGLLVFVGRVDDQIKIRGQRIELGEIENTLASCPGVAQAAVAVTDTPVAGPRLVACWVAEPCTAPVDQDLRAHLSERLPEVMVPAVFVQLDALPVTTSGKLDRRAVAESAAAEVVADSPPQGPIENAVASIWSSLLGVARVGTTDNFFALGGHSLLVPELVDQVWRQFGVDLPIALLFEAPTVAEFARAIEGSER
ncbi:amino acid adenylation domain-containing protein [Lentzea sp. JNUCC 0626]|uniref:amino acid adenylation domain-containing protein n=1 Tax=Lentzea sp. JNUCC 0626 TaxID=3367513 RepID=UPI00374934D9